MTPDDPLTGALLGGGVGFFAPSALEVAIRRFRTLPANQRTPNLATTIATKAQELAEATAWALPEIYRANLLSTPRNILINAWVGPWGSGMMAGLTKFLSGDPTGLRIMKRLLEPATLKALVTSQEWQSAKSTVWHALERTEMTPPPATVPKAIQEYVTLPGTFLTAGDRLVRRILMEEGVPEAEALTTVLASEPISKYGKGVADLRRAGGFVAKMLLPFYRANVNQLEHAFYRFPVLGLFLKDPRVSQDIRTLMAQQAVSLGTMATAYYLGRVTPPNYARITMKTLNNLGGQYGTLASWAFMYGQLAQAGKRPSERFSSVAQSFLTKDAPFAMPAGGIPQDLLNLFERYTKGQPIRETDLPYGAIPPFLTPEGWHIQNPVRR